MAHLLAIDQGTTSTRSIVFDAELNPVASAQQEFRQIYPAPGHVEHDPEEIWSSVLSTAKNAMAKAGLAAKDIAGIGITNQRETDDRLGSRNRQAAAQCHCLAGPPHRGLSANSLKAQQHELRVSARTGLLLDPYFSATKIGWILDHVEGAREAAKAGRLAFGTVDTFLLWRLTEGRVHATDATNAARTLLFDINSAKWHPEHSELFRVPANMLPEVRDCAAEFGTTAAFGGSIRILGIAGDQQAATIGQGCFSPGMMKSTYGTGCFALLNTGDKPVASQNRLLTTIAYQLNGKRTYALEGAIFIAGAAVQWLRDALKVIADAPSVNTLAASADPAEEVYLVPAFVGLGAPYWDAKARGAIFGLTRNSGVAELARATIESVGYQTRDLLDAMRADWPEAAGAGTVLRVDGGMTASEPAMQFLADILGAPVDRPKVMETTALGAAYLAGLQAGVCPDLEGFAKTWKRERRFEPAMDASDARSANGPAGAMPWRAR